MESGLKFMEDCRNVEIYIVDKEVKSIEIRVERIYSIRYALR